MKEKNLNRICYKKRSTLCKKFSKANKTQQSKGKKSLKTIKRSEIKKYKKEEEFLKRKGNKKRLSYKKRNN